MNYIFIMYVIIHVFLLSELKVQDTEEDTKSTQSSVSTIQKDLQTLQVATVNQTKIVYFWLPLIYLHWTRNTSTGINGFRPQNSPDL